MFLTKHAGSDSNTQPADLESAALPIELPASMRPLNKRTRYLLPLNLMKRVLTKSRAILFKTLFYLFVNAALHANTRAVI